MYAVVGYHFDPWIRDPGWVTNQDPGFGSRIISCSESLKTMFWVKILKFFDSDPDPGFATLPKPKKGNKGNSLFHFSFQHNAKK